MLGKSKRWNKTEELKPDTNEVVEICINLRLIDPTLIESREITKAIYKNDKFMSYGKEHFPIFWRRIIRCKM